jgi:hypothetical protein
VLCGRFVIVRARPSAVPHPVLDPGAGQVAVVQAACSG